MAQAVFVHEGCSIDYTLAADVAAGDVVVQGDLVEGSDLERLKLACRTGRMPGVTYAFSPTGRYGGARIAHMVNLVHADDQWFAVLDNNYPGADQPRGNIPPSGRDHNPSGFTMWLACGGVKPGLTYGATDDYGYAAVENKVHVHDLHATILHLLGLDHERLTWRHAGRDFRLTDVHGEVVKDILAWALSLAWKQERPAIISRACEPVENACQQAIFQPMLYPASI